MNFQGAYLGNDLADTAQIQNWTCSTLREFVQKKSSISVWGGRATDAFSVLL